MPMMDSRGSPLGSIDTTAMECQWVGWLLLAAMASCAFCSQAVATASVDSGILSGHWWAGRSTVPCLYQGQSCGL